MHEHRSVDFLNAVAAEVRASSQSGSGDLAKEAAGGPRSDELIRGIESGAMLVGELPPQPPTLRGQIGGILVGIIQRCLFWYTPRIVHFQRAVAAAFREQGQSARADSGILSQRISTLEQENRSMRQAVQAATQACGKPEAMLRDIDYQVKQHATSLTGLDELLSRIHALEEKLEDVSRTLKSTPAAGAIAAAKHSFPEGLAATTGTMGSSTATLSQDIAYLMANVEQATSHSSTSSEAKLDSLEKFTLSTRAEMFLLERRLSESLRKVQPSATASRNHQRASDCQKPLLSDVLYCDLVNHFRGAEEDIKARLQIYIPRLRHFGAGSPEMPVVDIGCGRGEWLELLREGGLLGYGVDNNAAALARCRHKGLTVEEQDGLEHIKSLPNSSMGAVSAFHFIEHLPMQVWLGFLDEALRVLKPGGVLLLETPNPDNVLVASSTFYLDPTHQRPIPSGLLRFLLHSRGFAPIEVLPLHPYPATLRLDDVDNPAAKAVNDRFFGCQDYGVVAVRP